MPCPVCQAPLVEVSVAEEPPASRSDFEQRVLDRYPYVIALPYRNMLDEQDGRGRLDLLAYTLQNALKYMGLLVVGFQTVYFMGGGHPQFLVHGVRWGWRCSAQRNPTRR